MRYINNTKEILKGGISVSLFVITDGNKNYVRRELNGKYVLVKSRALADEYEERWKAKKVLNNNLRPKERKKFFIQEEETGFGNIEQVDITVEEQIKLEVDDTIEKIIEQRSYIETFKKEIETIKKFLDDADVRRIKLGALLSNVDKEITDIDHYIELNNVDDSSKIKVFDMLKERLTNRREIKNELYILRRLKEAQINKSVFADLLNVVAEVKNRNYVPRILEELFIGEKGVEEC